MKISVFGCGYVGLTTAVGLAEMGNQVIGIDTDQAKVKQLHKGEVPFFEPGLDEMLKRNLVRGRISFSSSDKKGIQSSDIIICAVATPEGKRRQADLRAVLQVAESFAQHADRPKFFINKSTVPVGTTEQIINAITKKQANQIDFEVISNPEFLREGCALKDFFQPDRVIFGLTKDDKDMREILSKIFRYKQHVPIIFTSHRNAEIIKYASNAFLATRLSFINEVANFCDEVGGDIKDVAAGIGYDPRIGTDFFDAGIGFGGSCLPKDLQILISSGKKVGYDFPLLQAVKKINDKRCEHVIQRLKKEFKLLRGKKIAIWGLTFKPDTDDLRGSPAIKIAQRLLKYKAKVFAYDPAVQKSANSKIMLGKDPYEILKDADALLLLTEWNEFASPDFAKMKQLMRKQILVDGRNIYDPQELAANGFKYYGIGRSGY